MEPIGESPSLSRGVNEGGPEDGWADEKMSGSVAPNEDTEVEVPYN